jgi:undecaprenyl-phosphate 4-deoxy-4-formamido-L-arabinose transferase
MNEPRPGLSAIVPVYHSEQSLGVLIETLTVVLSKLGKPYEVILVNDGSTDGSWAVIERLAGEHPAVRGFNLMRNYGQHSALLCGVRAARYDTIVTLDDDLQNPPGEIPGLLAKLDEGYDVVYGTAKQMGNGMWRAAAGWVTRRALQRVMGAETARHVSAFRVFRTRLRVGFAHFSSPAVSIDVLLSWSTNRFSYKVVPFDERKYGSSNYTLRKLVNHAFDMMTGFSTLPLTVASYIGFFFATAGLALLVFVVATYLRAGGAVPGFSFLACTIVIFSGAQLFALGMIGQYLARMHWRSMDKPPYVVAQATAEEACP